MTSSFFMAVTGITLVAILLILSPFLRQQLKAQRRTGAIREELKTLNAANAAGSMSPGQYAASRQALGEALLDHLAIEPQRSAPILYSVIAVGLLMPLAAFGLYRWRGEPSTVQAHMSTTVTPAPLADHGSDIQAAISKLAAKLREHPDDAEGWALLGRTYKATEHYPEARDAFKHAVAAAPGDADFEREYAAAETPNVENRDEPQQCPTPGSATDAGCAVANTGAATIRMTTGH
jgi:cytochrome c-type biogenesis protein CcmH